ncbi:hypothetical protein SAY87_010256 [Trapa incisa]|uniref:Uncharacterized protein n=1 Tax=Trapa incisa TaxID=236973 RepID=A0AAN7GL91_9MYRT|nr:hypothetical protein SAY87_010256 [Trapa incisa]
MATEDPPSSIVGSPSSLSLNIKSHQVTGHMSLVAFPFVAHLKAALILRNVFEFPQLYHTSTSDEIIDVLL